MSFAKIFFKGELKDFFSSDNLEKGCFYSLNRKASVKDIIEALGPPHTEVGKIVIDSQEVGFDHVVQAGENIWVWPIVPPVDVTQKSTLREHTLDKIRFVVDVNVGKVAKLLRMLGFDTAYDWRWTDQYIADLAEKEDRIVLSKDKGLLKRNQVVWGRLIRAEKPWPQLVEVLNFFGLKRPFALFSRCLVCNTTLKPVDKEKIIHRLEPKTKKYFHRFYICPECDRIYWQGSHQEKMLAWLQRLGLD